MDPQDLVEDRHAPWRYAVGCVIGGRCEELCAARHLDPGLVYHALSYGLSYTRHDDRRRSGCISTAMARTVMRAWDSIEPARCGNRVEGLPAPHIVQA